MASEAEKDVVRVIDQSSVPYRTALESRIGFIDTAEYAREQLRVWLKSKSLDVERFDAYDTAIGPNTPILYTATNATRTWQLREAKEDGLVWVSTIGVTRAERRPGSAWVSVNIEALAKNGKAPAFAAPPRFIRLLLDSLDMYDGKVPLRSRATVVPAGDVQALLDDVVCADDRRLPVAVAAPVNDRTFEYWRKVIDKVTWGLPGLASMYLLDPVAAQEYNEAIGDTYSIGPGGIRTYLPGVDPALADDAIRHRVLSRRRIDADPKRASRVLVAIPRQLAATSMPSTAARSLRFTIRDLANARPSAVHEGQTEELQAEVRDLTELLEIADETDRQRQEAIERQEVLFDGQQMEILDLVGELEAIRDLVEARDATIKTLRRALSAAGQYEEAFNYSVSVPPLPKSFAELLDRIDEVGPGVIYTGDIGDALDLDEHPQNATWAQTTWQGLLALRDYMCAKEEGKFAGDFKRWCESPLDDGRIISPGKIAENESDTVRSNKRFASMRIFAVPVNVHQSGRIFMGAHIRIGRTSTISPRMYFYDAVKANGIICVGYIGRHLPNTLTS